MAARVSDYSKLRTAVCDYLDKNFDEALDIARQYWYEKDPDSAMLSYDEACDYIETMKPLDAFWLGRFSDSIDADSWYRFDGYGHLKWVYAKDYVSDVIEEICEDLPDGEYEISDELQAIIDRFMEEDEGSDNRKSAGTQRAKRPGTAKPKKQPAKTKTTAGCRPKASRCIKRGTTAKPKTAPKKAPVKKAPAKKPAKAPAGRR